MKKNQYKEIIDDLELHLWFCGWQEDHIQLVVDTIVETLKDNPLNDFYDDYNEIARNCGVAKTQPFDNKAISLINEIKESFKK
ncbi:MAG: hypothetical protein KAI72_10010 [Candidatus Pacebacteria bacterium]|nr:hypothetical protein [Candidatus Paceibacterota bacterium]